MARCKCCLFFSAFEGITVQQCTAWRNENPWTVIAWPNYGDMASVMCGALAFVVLVFEGGGLVPFLLLLCLCC